MLSSPGGNSATWRDSASATTRGSGTVLVERLVFGALRTLAPGVVCHFYPHRATYAVDVLHTETQQLP